MAVDFKTLLSKPLDEIKRPPALPAGTYHGIVQKYEFGESDKNKTPFVRFTFTIAMAGEDIDPSELEGIDLGKRTSARTSTSRKMLFGG